MKHVLILGPGASGKSTLAAYLGEITGPSCYRARPCLLAARPYPDASRSVDGSATKAC
jgi:nicotinamide riboside kinase